MDTYTQNFTHFQDHVKKSVSVFGADGWVAGLMRLKSVNHKYLPYTEQEMTERFSCLQQYGVKSIGIWDSPLPSFWFSLINKYLN